MIDQELNRDASTDRPGAAAALSARPTPLAPDITALLARLRSRIRAYVWLQGLALAVAWIGAAFWITLVLDWWIEPPALARQIMLGCVGVVLVWVLYRLILRRAFVRIADRNLAVLLERRFRQFGDSLLTTVELSSQPDHAEPFNPRLLDHTQAAALRSLPDVDLGRIFRRQWLALGLAAAGAAVVSVAAFALLLSGAFKIWVQRDLLFSDELWPRRTHLAVDGFPADKRLKIAKGSDLTITVKADTHYEVPKTVRIRYRTDETQASDNMSRVGEAATGDEFQAFSYVFRGILSSRSFDVKGGDMLLRDYQIDVVDVPTIEMTLHCDYPAYTRREARDLPVTGLVQLPQGTKITVRAKSNKDLVEVPVHRLAADKSEPVETIRLAGTTDRRGFTYQIASLDQDQTLLFDLLDADGIRTKEPVRLILSATPDEPPRVGVHLRGIGAAITPLARLPVEGEVTDDYGVAKIWFAYKLDKGPTGNTPDKSAAKAADKPAQPAAADAKEPDKSAEVRVDFRTAPAKRTSVTFDRTTNEMLDFKDRNLAVGQQITLTIMAEDNCTLKGGPNRAPGEQYQITVVSPEQLLSILEARELMLRMRLDAIIDDLSHTRDGLADLAFAPRADKPAKPIAPTAPAGGATADKKPAAAKPAADKPPRKLAPGEEPEDALHKTATPAGAEPGDENAAAAGRALRMAPVVVEQTLANSERGASETGELAAAFDNIRDEMVNNRIDTPELEYRLKDQIADPLREIAEKSFPELDKRLHKLQAVLADPDSSLARRDEALVQIDAILSQMRSVLNKMLELESFNEIVQQLREMIDTQTELNKQTQKRQKERALRSDE